MKRIKSEMSMSTKRSKTTMHPKSARRGFTLTQILLVMAIIGILAAMTLAVFGRSRASARRAQCDVNLKAITMALDAFRQEQGTYPKNLNELISKKYLTDGSILRCPTDVRPTGSYNDYYLMRASRDNGELPILVCPLCVSDGNKGLQAFKGRYTKQFATRPAQFKSVSGATIERPGKKVIDARSGMELRGGDIIRTPNGGSAEIVFADGSSSKLGGNSEITLLQSFIAGNSHAPLYTLIRQQAGDVVYKVTHGSKFDVTTPTATAGALGTAFEIKEVPTGTTADPTSAWWLKVTESRVLVSDYYGSSITSAPDAANRPAPEDGTPVVVTSDWTHMGDSEEVVITPNGRKGKQKKDKKDKNNDD